MGGDTDLKVRARIMAHNRELYEALVTMSVQRGMSQEEVNTHLINAGLVEWIENISRDLAKGPGSKPDDEEGAGEGGD